MEPDISILILSGSVALAVGAILIILGTKLKPEWVVAIVSAASGLVAGLLLWRESKSVEPADKIKAPAPAVTFNLDAVLSDASKVAEAEVTEIGTIMKVSDADARKLALIEKYKAVKAREE